MADKQYLTLVDVSKQYFQDATEMEKEWLHIKQKVKLHRISFNTCTGLTTLHITLCLSLLLLTNLTWTVH